jgi:hypothetical protein
MNEKLEILQRQLSSWRELYVNGDLVYEGEDGDNLNWNRVLRCFLQWLGERFCTVEVRVFYIDYDYDEKSGKEYTPPLHSIDGKNYWNDWLDAEDYNLYKGDDKKW